MYESVFTSGQLNWSFSRPCVPDTYFVLSVFVRYSFIFNSCLDRIHDLLDQPVFVFADVIIHGLRLRLVSVFDLFCVCLVVFLFVARLLFEFR